MPHSYVNLLYHCVFSTKDRVRFLHPEFRPRLFEYIGGAIRSEGGIALAVNGTEDHIHICGKFRQDKSVADMLRDIKAGSSGWIHRTFPELKLFSWQEGYGAFTVSFSRIQDVQGYISRQLEHHRQVTFQEEFISLLKAHQVEYDERYIWV